MTKIEVNFSKLDEHANDQLVGKLVWDGNELSDEPPGVLSPILETAISDRGKVLTKDTPVDFLNALHRHYKSAYFRASKAIGDVSECSSDTNNCQTDGCPLRECMQGVNRGKPGPCPKGQGAKKNGSLKQKAKKNLQATKSVLRKSDNIKHFSERFPDDSGLIFDDDFSDLPAYAKVPGDPEKMKRVQNIIRELPASHQELLRRYGVQFSTSADIKYESNREANGMYFRTANTIVISDRASKLDVPRVVRHEIGHAVDRSHGKHLSESPGFVDAWYRDKDKKMNQTYDLENSYYLTAPSETFAQVYAYLLSPNEFDRDFPKAFFHTIKWMREALPKYGLELPK